MGRIVYIMVIGFVLLFPSEIAAHEVRPAYLEIKQINETQYEMLWKVPSLGGAVPKIYPNFPSSLEVRPGGPPIPLSGSLRQKFIATSNDDIRGEFIGIDGISKTMIDVLLTLEFLDGDHYTFILQSDNPRVLVPEKPGFGQVAYTYVKLGVEHILFGIDHLLFVLALLLITRGFRKLIATITSFTLAHSITLSLTTLGYTGLPGPPVESVIALSIVFLAIELVRYYKGESGLTIKYPWVVAFTFGLLHGFGFAGALLEIGLPKTAVPTALLFFNIGVELGQIAFVIFVLFFIWMLKRLATWPSWTKWLAPYMIGSIAAFWLIERVVGYF